jgi:DNA invertase Pin-like site-specific DNA recombinase
MDRKRKVIIAVGYLRKSTFEVRTEKSIADQKARIKPLNPTDPDAEYQIVKWYDKDKGVPGWKRGARRPDYFKLVNELKETGATAILVDDMDRFSRADEMEVVHDVQELREKHGVRYIHAVNQGCIDLNDPQATWRIALAAMASHEFSTRLSRRIANARLDAAIHGKRSGGEAPYGFLMADEHGNPVPPGPKRKGDPVGRRLIHGDPKQVKIVRWIFDQFANHHKSMNWIAAELNRQKVPARHGGKWYVATIKELLQRREYRGDFSYNGKKSGQFHIVNGHHEVVRVSPYDEHQHKPWKITDEGRIIRERVYAPMTDPKLFDAAQERLAGFTLKGNRRPREGGYALCGILICDHCGKPMYGCHPTGRPERVYRCSTNAKTGCGTCGNYWIDETDILPFVIKLLGEEIHLLEKKLEPPKYPKKLKSQQDEKMEIEKQRDDLKAKVTTATGSLMLTTDKRTRQEMDAILTEMRNQLERLESELASDPTEVDLAEQRAQYAAYVEWWRGNLSKVSHIQLPTTEAARKIYGSEDGRIPFFAQADQRAINEALHALGCEVRLRWTAESITLSSGKVQNRYTFERGRYRLGQRAGDVSFCNAQVAAACSGNCAAYRRDSRRGAQLLQHILGAVDCTVSVSSKPPI